MILWSVCVCVLTDISFNHGMCCIETFYKYIDFHLFLVQKSFMALNLPLVLEIESPSNLKMLWQYYSHPPPNGFYEWSNIYTLPYYLVSLQYSFNILLISITLLPTSTVCPFYLINCFILILFFQHIMNELRTTEVPLFKTYDVFVFCDFFSRILVYFQLKKKIIYQMERTRIK